MYMHWLKVKPKTFVFMTVRIEKKIDEDFQINNDLCCEWVSEWLLFNAIISYIMAIIFLWDDDVYFELDQHS
jgi:hypothetical protein